MDRDELILEELRRIRIALETVAPNRWQKIPEAARSLGIPVSTLRKLADSGKIAVSIGRKTKVRKQYLIDMVQTRLFIEAGGFMPKIKIKS